MAQSSGFLRYCDEVLGVPIDTMGNARPGLDTKHFEPVRSAAKDYRCKVCKTYFDAKCPNCNPQTAEELKRELDDTLEGFVRETATAMLNGRNTIVALRELAEKSAKASSSQKVKP